LSTEEVKYLDITHNFERDKRVLRCRIDTILKGMEKNLMLASANVSITDIFDLIVASKNALAHVPGIGKINFKSVEALSKSGLTVARDMSFFEKELLAVYLCAKFESFCKDIVLLGAFYYPDNFISLASNRYKKSKIEEIKNAVTQKNHIEFFKWVSAYFRYKSRIESIIETISTVFDHSFSCGNEVINYLEDLSVVRNVIVHNNSKPNRYDFKEQRTKLVIKENRLSENIFFKPELSDFCG
jgi:hypothetical protein